MYSIKDLERLTGIKAHTIRIWEKRYKIVSPDRSDTNIRQYSDEDLKRLLNIALLNRHGERISRLAELSAHELREKVISLNVGLNTSSVQIEHLIISMIDLDEIKFESILNRSIIKNGFEETLNTLLIPFFDRVGVLWQAGSINPAQEHFVSNLIRQKLFVAIDRVVPENLPNSKRIVFFLHENELHEIGLLFYSYIAKKWGMKTIYLGQIVPLDDLKMIYEKVKPECFFTSFTSSMEEGWVADYIEKLSLAIPEATLLISGMQVCDITELPNNVEKVKDAADFKKKLQNILEK